ncbi:MAG: Fic family protein [Propionibacteriaceae bacterium]|nr:Fic family protein [Propionibacteriaceae bacterium]
MRPKPDSVPVEPVAWEDRRWEPNWSAPVSRRQREQAGTAYRSAIMPKIAGLDVSIPTGLMVDLEEATAEIARLDTYLAAKFPEDELAPMQTVLLRTESASSSQLENISVGARQLAIAELGQMASRNAMLVASNVAAMRSALELAKDISTATILKMHHTLMGQQLPDAGNWRQGQVWIGPGGSIPPTVSYVPPRQELVPAAMNDLAEFISRQDIPALAHAAIAHAQFENIHPFSDGNGRTGRALLHAIWRNKGVSRTAIVPVSSGLLVDTAGYFAALGSYREGDAGPIITMVAQGAMAAVGQGRALAGSLHELLLDWEARLRTRSGSAASRALSVILGQPAVNISILQDRLGVSQPTALAAVNALVAADILRPTSDKQRNRVWVAEEAIAVMDSFATSLGRRNGLSL